MHIPRANQGRMVEVSYGWIEGRLYRRAIYKSDRSEAWAVARNSKALRDYQEDDSSQLWDEPPPEKITWKNCEDPTK